jgi:cytochrome c oxidase assembly protein subunit 15
LAAFVAIGYAALRALAVRDLRPYGLAVLGLLLAQVTLGIANVLASLPLPVAVAHNGVAALLLVTLVMLNFTIRTPTTFRR